MRIKQQQVIILGFFAGLLLWVTDAVLDKINKFPNEPFIKILLYDAPTHEFLIRPIMLLSFTLFGILIASYMKKIQQSENKYRYLFDSISDIVMVRPFIQQTPKEKYNEVNPVASQKLGYTREELLQLAPSDLIAPERLTEFPAVVEGLRANGHILFETALVTKAGETIPVEMNSRLIDFGGTPSILCIVRDITQRQKIEAERRKAEECLRESEQQLRVLTARLLEVQEDERGRITKELHDELGQALMLLKIQVSGVMDHLRKDQGKLRQECAQILNFTDVLVEDIRRLIRDLSPAILEELGLISAIKLLLEDLGKKYQIDSGSVDFDDIDHLFPPRIQLAIYRIFQESLTNLGKHAEATRVSSTIKKLGDKVRFSIKDNGRGFNLPELLLRGNGTKGIGLSTMRERIRSAGGQLEIKSQEGVGTEVAFMIPLELEEETENDHL